MFILPVVAMRAQIETSIPSDKPKLVIGIVVEQMRQDYIDRFWDNFGNRKGEITFLYICIRRIKGNENIFLITFIYARLALLRFPASAFFSGSK